MGKIKKILSEKKIKSKSHYYPDFFTVEVCENFHIHWRNTRIQLLKDEWEVFNQAIITSNNKWNMLNKPYPHPQTIYLHPAFTKLDMKGFDPTRMAIEHQDVGVNNLPEYHFHYRNIRIDMNKEELKEMIQLFTEADKKLWEEELTIICPKCESKMTNGEHWSGYPESFRRHKCLKCDYYYDKGEGSGKIIFKKDDEKKEENLK